MPSKKRAHRRQQSAEEVLHESELLHRNYLDALGLMRGIVEVVAEGELRHVVDDEVSVEYLGLTPESMHNKLGSELGESAEIRRRWVERCEESRCTEKPVQFEYVDRRAEKAAWLSATVNYLGTNSAGEPRFAYVVKDISEQKRAEMALRESEERYRLLAENSADIIMLHSSDGRLLYESPSFGRLTGWSPDELISTEWRTRVHPEDLAAVEEAHEANLRGNSTSVAYRFRCKDGSWICLETNCQIIFGPDGKPHQRLLTSRDISSRKQAEAALRESEQKHRLLFESSRDAIMTLAPPDWRFTSGNPATLAMFRSANEAAFVASVPWQLSPEFQPDGRRSEGKAREVIETAMREGSYFFEWTHQRLDGEVFPATVLLTRFELAGQPMLQATVRDITNRMAAERALRESEARFRALVQASSDVMYQMSPDWMEMRHLLGRNFIANTEEPDRTWLQKYIHPDDQAQLMSIVNHAIRTKSIFELEHRVWRVDGRLGWMFSRAVPILDASGEITEWFGMASDVTERKQAELGRLERLRRMLEEGQRLAHLGSWEFQVDTGETVWSDEQFRIFGLEPGPQPPNYADLVQEHFHPDDAARVDRDFTAAVESGSPMEWEHRIVRPDGSVRVLHELALPHFDADGKLDRYLGATLDITERKRTEAQLEASLRDLHLAQEELVRKERLATLGKLAGSVAHEIRTPLSIIQNNLRFLVLTLPSSDPELRDVLAEMVRAVGNSDHIITEMLDYVREPVGSNSAFPIRKVVSDALHRVPLPQTVQFRGPDGSASAIEVRGNQDQITRLLINLFQNAIQAMPQGGTLEMNARREEGGKVRLSVLDTGCGIPEENLKRVFEPLFSTKIKGIGLGLAIAQRYAQLNGGSLSVESKVGQGTTFWLILNAAS